MRNQDWRAVAWIFSVVFIGVVVWCATKLGYSFDEGIKIAAYGLIGGMFALLFALIAYAVFWIYIKK